VHALFLLLFVVAIAGCAGSSVDEPFSTVQIEAELEFNPERAVIVEGDNGDVTIRHTDSDSVRVRAEIRGRGGKRVAAAHVRMQASEAGDLSIRVDWPVGWRQPGEQTTLQIDIPGCSALTVHTGNGGIDLAGLGGSASLNSGNGVIVVADHVGDIVLSTTNGSVEAARIDGGCRVRTSNGRVEAAEVAGRVSITTTNGAVEVRLTEENPGPTDIRTANGRVDLAIGSGFAGDLRLETFNGRVRIFDVSGDLEFDDDREWAVIHRPGTERSLVRTSNGIIVVRPR
jgi:DUF4097 and DUF4098 domain-containing protein YvlB